MNFLTITGWAQKQDSLQKLANEKSEFFDYIKFKNYKELSLSIKKTIEKDVVIAWSLGTQIANRLIAEKKLSARLLVLIAPPYQFVSDIYENNAINHLAFMAFKNAFHFMPSKTLQKFTSMIAFNDSNLREIAENITIDENNHENWEGWLEEIGNFSCKSIDFSSFPRTFIIHGNMDTVVDIRQIENFKKKIKDLRVEVVENTGHAPHLHNPELIKKIIVEECNLIKNR